MWYPDNQLKKKLNICMLCILVSKNQVRMQNMYKQFKYKQLHISAKITEIKLLKF